MNEYTGALEALNLVEGELKDKRENPHNAYNILYPIEEMERQKRELKQKISTLGKRRIR